MSHYADKKKYDAKEIDYDLEACLKYNPQEGYGVDNIMRVLAVVEGERDGADWHWVFELENEKLCYLRGGCDFTGWDCQSWASSVFIVTLDELVTVINDGLLPVSKEHQPMNAGLGHILNLLSGTYKYNDKEVLTSLLRQLVNVKNSTWREDMDKEFPDFPLINN